MTTPAVRIRVSRRTDGAGDPQDRPTGNRNDLPAFLAGFSHFAFQVRGDRVSRMTIRA
ncbi:hypothetical protein [Plantactinospora soyae]|uniref:Uncharacterized protein n=1 Tax=Plantactinospora soyae TaxID=1544732 RepID=A0A927MBC8_9ACTN|nr:hypothetical protein [Plantactinospora soyae]MBE1491628.1 hypothetical protein [Plantactinospora soyae]